MKTKKKQPSLEYAPATEAELRKMAEVHANAAMYCELCELAKPSWYSKDSARRHYVVGEAYERWADELKAKRLFTDFEESVYRMCSPRKRAPYVTVGVGQWVTPTDTPNPNKLNVVA